MSTVGQESRQKNRGYQLSGIAKLVRTIAGSEENFKKLARSIRSVAPVSIVKMLTSVGVREIPPISQKDRLYVQDLLKGRTEELQKLTGFDVSSWC